MRIGLFIPCYVDQFFPRVGICVAEVLERLGHEVGYPEDLTCCGQPSYNPGFHDEAARVARTAVRLFDDYEAVVVPSGSCAAMIRTGYPDLFAGRSDEEAACRLTAKTWEFSEFLTGPLGLTDIGARFPATVTFHDGCHGLRELGVREAPRTLLSHVRDLTLVEMGEAETCCGFGGTFAVKFPAISTAMAEVKCRSIIETGAEYVVSSDPSCLMQIKGYLERNGNEIRARHLAEVLHSL